MVASSTTISWAAAITAKTSQRRRPGPVAAPAWAGEVAVGGPGTAVRCSDSPEKAFSVIYRSYKLVN
jgi:hypothetical protein